jgi:hypothetical protein
MIARIDLHPPLSYLRDIHRQVREDKTDNSKTDEVNSIGSTIISGSGPKETRTPDLISAIDTRSQLRYRPIYVHYILSESGKIVKIGLENLV